MLQLRFGGLRQWHLRGPRGTVGPAAAAAERLAARGGSCAVRITGSVAGRGDVPEDRFGRKPRGCLEGFHGISNIFLPSFNEIVIFWIGFKYISMRCSWNCEWNCPVYIYIYVYMYIYIYIYLFRYVHGICVGYNYELRGCVDVFQCDLNILMW